MLSLTFLALDCYAWAVKRDSRRRLMFIQQLSIALGIISLVGFIASSGKQKKISAFLLGFSLLSGIISFSAQTHQSQSLSRQSVGQGQSAGQEQQPLQEMAPIEIVEDGDYELPALPLKVCFTLTGLPEKDFYMDQKITIGDWSSLSQRKTGCQDIPNHITGKVYISLGSAGKEYTPDIRRLWGIADLAIKNDYTYSFVKGVGKFPILQAR